MMPYLKILRHFVPQDDKGMSFRDPLVILRHPLVILSEAKNLQT